MSKSLRAEIKISTQDQDLDLQEVLAGAFAPHLGQVFKDRLRKDGEAVFELIELNPKALKVRVVVRTVETLQIKETPSNGT